MNRFKDLTLLALALGFVIVIGISIAQHIPTQATTPTAQDVAFDDNTTGWQFKQTEAKIGLKLTTQDLKGIDISRTYTMGPWRYAVTHLVPPGHRYHLEARLYYRGQEVPEPAQINDYITTPWGNVYWAGWTQVTRYGSRGWIRVPNPRYPIGTNVTPTYLKG